MYYPAISQMRGCRDTAERDAIAVAPCRVDLTGGYTDVAPYVVESTGRAVNAAVRLYATAVATLRNDGWARVSRDGREIVRFRCADARRRTPQNLVALAVQRYGPKRGVAIDVYLDAPPQSGLGTSGAVSVAVVSALLMLRGSPASDPRELARMSADTERAAEIAGGLQDQCAAAFGAMHDFSFGPGDPSPISARPLSGGARSTIERGLIAHAGGGRESDALVRRVMSESAAGRSQRMTLDRLAQMAPRVASALLTGSVEDVGRNIGEVLALQRRLDPEIRDGIDSSMIYKLVDARLCWGKPLGGAGPGAAWFLLPAPNKRTAVIDALTEGGVRWWPVAVADRVRVISHHPSADQAAR